jgi:DNA adenine methylase
MGRYKTPLRYPGGKQKITPFIRELLTLNGLVGGHYAEPYAGGAGIAMELLVGGEASHVHLNDSCAAVYSFWRSVLTDTEELCRRISRASLTVREWRRQKEILSRPKEFTRLDVGFSMFYLNRCNRSGILSGGLIGGLRQLGEWKMDARFPRKELIARIEAIALRRKAVTLYNLDAEQFIVEVVPELPRKALIYCDPPYFHKADRLYLNHYQPKDHIRIAQVVQRTIKQPWLVSYDNTSEVVQCYSRRRAFSYDLQYNAARVYHGSEIFFFSDRLKLPAASSVRGISRALNKMPARVRAGILHRWFSDCGTTGMCDYPSASLRNGLAQELKGS